MSHRRVVDFDAQTHESECSRRSVFHLKAIQGWADLLASAAQRLTDLEWGIQGAWKAALCSDQPLSIFGGDSCSYA